MNLTISVHSLHIIEINFRQDQRETNGGSTKQGMKNP